MAAAFCTKSYIGKALLGQCSIIHRGSDRGGRSILSLQLLPDQPHPLVLQHKPGTHVPTNTITHTNQLFERDGALPWMAVDTTCTYNRAYAHQ